MRLYPGPCAVFCGRVVAGAGVFTYKGPMGDDVTKTASVDVPVADYVVLARKYRSRTFGELIGQDALVRTLTNAIKAQKIHHAYVLTGIRGTGKTSTARLLAMALNCKNGPAVTWDLDDPEVEAIRTGRHVDVFEFDAASNRGVEDVQRLFEGVNYAPSAGRYKVYIIDEVHMLSTTAFNALLKTLEEPPERVKFIFATTEVHKIPVTVLSRCQRFDLKRVPSEVLAPYFTEILGKEKIEAEPAAVTLIARAADGSVRDGLSLLDQAIALSHGDMVRTQVVQGMLGLADKARVFDLLEALLAGGAEQTLALLDGLYEGGQDALGVVQGLLEVTHLLTRLKIVPGLAEDVQLTELERTRAVPLAVKVGMANLGRLYQMLMQALAEVRGAERPYEALSMAAVRMAYLAPLPAFDKLLGEAKHVVEAASAPKVAASAGAMAVHEPREVRDLPVVEVGLVGSEVEVKKADLPGDWKGVVQLVRPEKPGLAAALERQARCVGMSGVEVRLVVEKGLLDAKDLVRELRAVLRTVSGVSWQIVQELGEAGPVASLAEEEARAAEERREAATVDPLVAEVLGMFPGAEVEEVRAETVRH
ncbi:MAG: DNA polymerase III subunit gamma/tau [Proteobacteria bacterium]|nr:DNA polymerase III subunit gamma/tau [Pseudomonadota bacterium]